MGARNAYLDDEKALALKEIITSYNVPMIIWGFY